MQYFISRAGSSLGPFTLQELRQQRLSPHTKVWREGLTEWVEASQLPELNLLWASTPPTQPRRKWGYKVFLLLLVAVTVWLLFTRPTDQDQRRTVRLHLTETLVEAEPRHHLQSVRQLAQRQGRMEALQAIQWGVDSVLQCHNRLLYCTSTVQLGDSTVLAAVGLAGRVLTLHEEEVAQCFIDRYEAKQAAERQRQRAESEGVSPGQDFSRDLQQLVGQTGSTVVRSVTDSLRAAAQRTGKEMARKAEQKIMQSLQQAVDSARQEDWLERVLKMILDN